MKTLTNYPPLTSDDILALKGQPMAKKVKPNNGLTQEEWIYYRASINSKEHYIFKNGRLIEWSLKLI